ncbi:MFS transporter [Streptomyces sp. NPDC060194]|uniref:PP2C family protein-serine/threonine phosphatase n=1 Tax=Streptomyces sp. NPDC060194 TaxID=3347069 RepID=UPI00364E8FE5
MSTTSDAPTVRPGPLEPRRRRLLAAGLALGVLAPTLHVSTLVRAGADLGMDGAARGWTQVLVVCASLAGVLGAGPVADRLGARRTVVASLLAACTGGVLVVAAWTPWAYQAGLFLESAGIMGAAAGYLASVPVVHLTGRLGQAVGAAFAVIAAALAAGVTLALVAEGAGGWRAVEAVPPAATAALIPAALRFLPGPPPVAPAPPSPHFWAGGVVVVVLGGVLQANPLRYWQDIEVVALLVAALAVLVLCSLSALPSRRDLRGRPAAAGPDGGTGVGAVVVVGGVWGFGQSALATVMLVLLTERGLGQDASLAAWAGFGAGFVAAGLFTARYVVGARDACALGLTTAAVGVALLSTLPHGHGVATVGPAALLAAVAGFGIVLPQVPCATRFLAGLPARGRGAVASVYPASVVLGGAAVTGIPYESVISQATRAATVRELLWITVTVLALAALATSRSVVPLAVAGAAVAQYLLVAALSDDFDARRPQAMAAYLLVGAAVGAAVWARGRQSERLTRSLADASALQEAVLRPLPARAGDLDVSGLYRPATAGTGIGGDFYDVATTSFGTRVLIGDVRGKGLQAVRTVADILGCFRSQAHETAELCELAARLDRHLARIAQARNDGELFATALLLEHRDGGRDLRVLNCGHLPPVAVGPGHRVHEVDLPAVLPLGLGVLDLADHRPAAVPLPLGTVLLLYTDGLTEARDASDVFYPLADRLPALPATSLPELLHHLAADVEQWTLRLTDDIALLALRRTGPSPDGS